MVCLITLPVYNGAFGTRLAVRSLDSRENFDRISGVADSIKGPPKLRKWPFVVGAVFILIGSLFVYIAISGIQKGQIMRLSRFHYSTVTRQDDPVEFWHVESVLWFTSGWLVVGVLMILGEFQRRKQYQRHQKFLLDLPADEREDFN